MSSREEQFQKSLLAVQQGLLEQTALLSALRDWMKDERQSLMDILLAQTNATNKDELASFFSSSREKKSHTRGMSDEDIAKVQQLLVEAKVDPVPVHESHATSTRQFDSEAWATERINQGESNRFRIINQHAKGGLGVIYVAEDTQLHRTVALKQIQGSATGSSIVQEKFYLEAEVTGQLEHPGIVPVYALGIDDRKQPFYAMRFIRGEDLRTHINNLHEATRSKLAGLDGLALRQLLRRFLDVCNAMEYAHARGVLHRDLKPANVMLGSHGETLVVDWGLAKVMTNPNSEPVQSQETKKPKTLGIVRLSGTGGQTVDGSFGGTLAYAPPEQLAGKLEQLCPQSDIYSLGAILYQLLTGVPPITGKVNSIADLIVMIENDRIPRPRSIKSGVPKPLEAICRKAMSPEISARYSSAKELATDVEFWLADECVLAYRGHEPRIEQAGRLLRRHRSWTVSVGTSLIIVALLATLAAYVVNQYRLNEQRAKRSAQEFKSDAVERYKIAKDAMDTLVLGSSESLADFPAMKDLQQKFLQKAADGFSQLSKNSSPDPALEVERVHAIVRLADTLHVQEKIDAAHVQYQTAISILNGEQTTGGSKTGLFSNSLSDFERQLELGRIYSRLGLAYDNEEKYDEARHEFDRAISTFLALEPLNPDSTTRKGNLAIALSNKGSMEARLRNASTASELLSASLPFFDAAIVADEARYSLAAASSRESLARVLRDVGEISKAREFLNDAQVTLTKLLNSNADNPDFLEAIASLHVSRAKLEHSQGDLILSLKELDAAEAVYRKLKTNWPNSIAYVENLHLVIADQGIARLEQGEIGLASERFDLASNEFYELHLSYPKIDRFRLWLATALSGMGQSKAEVDADLKEAERLFDHCIEIGSALATKAQKGNTTNLSVDDELTATFRSQYAKLLHAHREFARARSQFDASIPALESSIVQNNELAESQVLLAHAYWRRGLLEFDDHQIDLAKEYFDKSVEQWRKLVGRVVSPVPVYDYELALCYLRCPDESRNDYPKAEGYLKACYEKVPDNHSFATAFAEAAIRNGKGDLSSEILGQIKNTHGAWHAMDHIVHALILLSEEKVDEAKQAIEKAKQWAAENRPMNLDIQRQIKQVSSVARLSEP